VLIVCLRLTSDRLVAVATALLFAAHAIHTEAVAGIVGRAELMSAVFFLSSFLLYLRSDERTGRSSTIPYIGSLTAFALSLLSKENGISLLGVIVCHDVLYRSNVQLDLITRTRTVLAERLRSRYLGYALVAIGYLALRHVVLMDGGSPVDKLDNPLAELSASWRVLNALQVALRYLGLLVFPLNLSYDYSYNQIPILKSLADPRSLAVIGGSAAILATYIIAYRRSRTMFFALAFLAITFIIVSNLVIPIGTIMGERLLYLPSIGFCLALVLALRALARQLPLSAAQARSCLWSALVALVLLHGVRTVVRNCDWTSEGSLLLHDLAVNPSSAKVQANAGAVLMGRGEVEVAMQHFRKAVAIHPDYGGAYGELGNALVQLGREKEAIEVYEAAVRRPLSNGLPLNNLGFLLVERGIDPVRGVKLLEAAVRLDGANPHFLDSLGWAYYKTSRPSEGRALVARSLEIDELGVSGRARREHLRVIDAALAHQTPPSAAQLPAAR
jgi:tetratricopeptide (TPR) repeat protein